MASLDHRIVAWMSGLDLPLVTPLAKALSAVGASGLVFIVVAAMLSARSRRAAPVVLTLATVILADTISRAMKGAFDRPRPSVAHADVHALVAVPGNASMPSGHAWIAFAAAVVVGGSVVGVLGPTRLAYPEAIGTVRFISGLMNELVDHLYN